jgi:predicted CXXCH cytochrome family protein
MPNLEIARAVCYSKQSICSLKLKDQNWKQRRRNMKKALALAVLVLLVVSAVQAADMITVKAKIGAVTFNHKVHSAATECKVCHGEGTPGKLTLGQEPAHKLCTGCHKTKKAGPTKCYDCHKKK